MQEMDIRIGSLEGAYLQVADRLNSMDRSLAAWRTEVRADVAELRRDLNQRFAWILGLGATAWVTTILAVMFHK